MNSKTVTKLKNQNSTTFSPVPGKKLLDRTIASQSSNEARDVSNPEFRHNFGDVQVESPSFKQSCPLSLSGPSHCPFGGACHTCAPRVQTKLKIGQPGDKYEQEADRVAEQVMRMAEPKRKGCLSCSDMDEEVQIQKKPVVGRITPLLQRQVEENEEEEEEEIVQAKETADRRPEITVNLQSDIQDLKGGGRPLDPVTRSFMESRFGHDFSQVRIHNDAHAAGTASRLMAQAYTIGKNIVFDPKHYAPDTYEGKQLVAHELAHVIQQGYAGDNHVSQRISDGQFLTHNDYAVEQMQTSVITNCPQQITCKGKKNNLKTRIEHIDKLLSYGITDWVITDAEAIKALEILKKMTNEERIQALPRIDIERLQDNLPQEYQSELAVLIASGSITQQVFGQVVELLSYDVSGFDWVITDEEAQFALYLLQSMPDGERDSILRALGPLYRQRLWENLPSDEEKDIFIKLWDEMGERHLREQISSIRKTTPQPAPDETPVKRKHRQFIEWIKHLSPVPEPKIDLLQSEPNKNRIIPDSHFVDREARFRYWMWIDREKNNPEYLSLSPGDLYGRFIKQIYEEVSRSYHARKRIEEKVRRESKRSMDKYNEFQKFIRDRMKRLKDFNEAEVKIQEAILRPFIQWVAQNQGTAKFLRAKPLKVYERIAHGVVTPEMDIARIRAAGAPQSAKAREKKLDEFLSLAQKLREFRNRFPYVIPIPSKGVDLLIHGDPAQQAVFDSIASTLNEWAIRHYNDAEFAAQSPTVVLSSVVKLHQPALVNAALEPLAFEYIARTELDPDIIARSFVTTLGKVLLAAAIIGVVVGAEILTLGQVTWLLVGLGAAMGGYSYQQRRKEIEETGVQVPRAETIVHSTGDVIGLSQLIEGATGLRLGTQRQLNSIQRSESLGVGSASVVGVFAGSRAFRLGKSTGANWRASAAKTPGGKLDPGALLPGPKEHFPFGSGTKSMPVPESPNSIYRIMGLEEASQALRNSKMPTKEPGTGTMGNKFFSLDSKYVMLFREKALAKAQQLGKGVAAQEAKLFKLQNRIKQMEAAGNTRGAARLRGNAEKLQAKIKKHRAEVKEASQALIDDWFGAPGQKIVVEIELQPGALEHMLNRAVPENVLSQYKGGNVYIWKLERGYGRNIAVPPWQLGVFNSLIKSIRLHSWRTPFGPKGITTKGSSAPGLIPKGEN